MNFPAGPINGQTTTVNGIVYIYDDTKTAWKRSTSFGGNLTILGNITSANVVTGNVYTSGGIYWSNNGAAYSSGGGGASNFLYTASATVPTSPTKGDQWFDTTDGGLYEYMDDGDSFQWVDIQTPTLASNAVITALSGDVSTDGNISASSIVITSGIYWSNGVAFVSSIYGDSNVEAYIGANIGTLYLGNITTQANLGELYLANITTQANLGELYLGNISTQANLGQLYIDNITNQETLGILYFDNVSTQANLGAFQTFSNANAATQATSINTINANLGAFQSYANTKIGTNTNSNLVVVATSTSANTTSGALVVRGGVGVAGNVYADKLYTTNGLYWAGNGVAFSSGGGGSPFATNLVAASGTTTSSTTTGALVVVGGAGITGGLYVGGDTFHTTGFIQTLNAITSTSADTGAITTQNGGGLGVTGNLYVGNEFVVPGGGKITSSGLAYLLEKVTVTSGAPSGNVNIDLSTQSVIYWTGNATGNVSANIRGTATQPLNSLLAVGQSVTAVIFLPNGPSNFLVTNVYIDNTTVAPAYQGNAAPVLGNSNSMDIYSFTILKTASATYKVFASQTQFMHPG